MDRMEIVVRLVAGMLSAPSYTTRETIVKNAEKLADEIITSDREYYKKLMPVTTPTPSSGSLSRRPG